MRILALLALLTLTSLVLPETVRAQEGVTASVSGQANGLFSVDEDIQPAGSVAVGIVLGDPSSNVEGSAEASFGVLRSFANAQLDYTTGTSPTTNVSSLAQWTDLVTITSPDLLNGSQAIVRYRVVLEGTGFGLGNSLPSNFAAIGSYMLSVGYFGSSSSNKIYDDLFAGPLETVDLDCMDTALVVLGEGMEFQVQLIGNAQVYQPGLAGSYEAEMDISRTMLWGGVAEVTDTMGNPVAFDIQSEAGVDWSQPAPEPRGGLLVGMITLAGFARLKTRRDESPRA